MFAMSSISNYILHHSGEKTSTFNDFQHFSSIQNTTKARYENKFDLVYHFVVGQTGKIFNGQKEGEVCPHCGIDKNEGIINNWNSLGICCVGNFDEETMPLPQFSAVVGLLKNLNKKYEVLRSQIYKHSSMVSTACPGKNFPFESILQEVYMDPKIYPDVSEKDWYYKPVKFCKDKKFMNGDEFGFRPDDKVTRAELAATIYKIFHQEES